MPSRPVVAAWADQYNLQGELSLKVFSGEPLWVGCARELREVSACLEEAHRRARAGECVIGYVAYEAAPAFDPALPVKQPAAGQPLAVWVAMDPAQIYLESVAPADGPTLSVPWVDQGDTRWFENSFGQIRGWIEQGEFYQINLTTRLKSDLERVDSTNAWKLFLTLYALQPTRFASYLDLDGSQCISLSPEQFFCWDGSTLSTSPMKGTRKPGDDSQLPLRDSAKDRAENIMIVDLLRNDMARVCEPRSVQVKSLFDVMELPSVEQMTSTIQGRTRAGLRLTDIFAALFPCGSVTGAPKHQAMSRIAELETSPRGVYCGAMGLMLPGGEVRLNVPIRTVFATHGELTYGVGSGMTWYSEALAERKEWWQKTQFLRQAGGDFKVLETLRLQDGQLIRLNLHLDRMERACSHFGFVFVREEIERQLAQWSAERESGVFRVRLLAGPEGQLDCQCFELDSPAQGVCIQLAAVPFTHRGEFVQYKTTQRAHYDAFAPKTSGVFDTLLYDESGFITESCRFNVVCQIDNQLLTPRMSTSGGANLLNGVFRASLLGENVVREAEVSIHELSRIQACWLINSLREWVEVDAITDSKGCAVYRKP